MKRDNSERVDVGLGIGSWPGRNIGSSRHSSKSKSESKLESRAAPQPGEVKRIAIISPRAGSPASQANIIEFTFIGEKYWSTSGLKESTRSTGQRHIRNYTTMGLFPSQTLHRYLGVHGQA